MVMANLVKTKVFDLALWCRIFEPSWENKKCCLWAVDIVASKNFHPSFHTADFGKFPILVQNSEFCWAILELSNWAELGPPKYIFGHLSPIVDHGIKHLDQLKNAPFRLI